MKFDKKIMLGVFGASSRGKSSTLLFLIEKLKLDENNFILINEEKTADTEKDKIAIFEKNGLKIGVSTAGDIRKIVKKEVEKLIKEECEIIITATRSKGKTTDIFNQLAKEYEYKAQWFEKNTNAKEWSNEWLCKDSNLKKSKEMSVIRDQYLNKLNETDAQFLFDYIDSLTQ
ncbi:hypothetical protein L1K40_26395 [Escherichia coli]|nr:hypothetical protein [Escherichia coli]